MSTKFSIHLYAFVSFALLFSVSALGETPTWEELEKRANEILTQERSLVEQFDSMKPEYQNPESLIRGLNQTLSTLTPEQKAELHKARNIAKEDPANLPEQVQSALKQVQDFDAVIKPFQQSYDQYNLDRTKFFSDYYLTAAEDIVKAAKASGADEGKIKKMEEKLQQVREKHKAFGEKLALNDASRDKGWLGNFWDERRALLELSHEAGSGIRTWGERAKNLMAKLEGPYTFGKMLAASAVFLPRSLADVPLRGPMIKHGRRGSAAAGWSVGLGMQYEGGENLPAKGPPNTLNVVVGNHTTSALMGMMDGWSLGHMIGENPVLVDGGIHKMIPALKQAEIENPNNILVSVEVDPVTQVMERYNAGKMHTLFAFPEGNTFEGNVYGLRPWQDGFSVVMLENLRRRKGLDLTLTTFTNPRHYRFWNNIYANPDDRKDLLTKVHTTMESPLVDVLMTSGDMQRAARMSRQIMIASLDENNNDDRRLGTPSFDKLVTLNETAIQRAIRCNKVWGKMKPGAKAEAPVEAKLGSAGGQ